MQSHQLKIILVKPSHPGNIGATARAMKTMGFEDLVLVDPKEFPSDEANALATHAIDVLEKAQVVKTLDEALEQVNLVMATSARSRHLDWPMLSPKQAAVEWLNQPQGSDAALVFGCERCGLSNEDLAKCHFHIQIPTASTMHSLNLAQAVQVLCYQFFASFHEKMIIPKPTDDVLAAHGELEGLYQHMAKSLQAIGVIRPSVKKGIMPRLRRIFQKAKLQSDEVNILRGIFKAIESPKVHHKSQD